jgi:archaemetzincin
MKNHITLLPIGDIDAAYIQKISPDLEKTFDAEVASYPAMNFPRDAYNPVRDQYLAALVITRMRQWLSPEEHEKVLGITEKDLYADEMNFIFGQAEMPGQLAVISIARLRPSFYGRSERKKIIIQRMLKEAIHELGHTFNLRHCSDPYCVMHFSLSLKDTDKKNSYFCGNCRKKLVSQASFRTA